ncbi:hypothetical protein [Spirosoma endophyticum]|uniref:Uncharacterized protein n=1 Tax=Spirosoma endophyticum TaxID=662367 RepID=A0A1I1UFD5_9BACT|nr:hypothetical protein [Spirosoma endophyticum]SFD67483.1 hypothetical protein SAMN05216167_106180 [Spirosoma endophyticum]
MAYTQVGYLGNTGPIFTDDSPGGGKKIMLVGRNYGGVMKLVAVQPAYVANLNGGFAPADFVLGNYVDLQVVGDAPTYRQPSTGAAFVGYVAVGSDWVTATSTAGNEPGTGSGGTTTGGSTSTGGGSTSTGGGSVSTGGDTTFSAPTIMEQVSTFLSNYWWLVLIIVGFLLWKPFIAPALGFSKKRRR